MTLSKLSDPTAGSSVWSTSERLVVELYWRYGAIQVRAVRRRRRRRPNVGVAPAPFLWRVHVMLYTSYMLLDFCNSVYNEALTLTKTVRTMRACFVIALDIQMKHGSVKASVLVDNFVKSKADTKSFVLRSSIWNF